MYIVHGYSSTRYVLCTLYTAIVQCDMYNDIVHDYSSMSYVQCTLYTTIVQFDMYNVHCTRL